MKPRPCDVSLCPAISTKLLDQDGSKNRALRDRRRRRPSASTILPARRRWVAALLASAGGRGLGVPVGRAGICRFPENGDSFLDARAGWAALSGSPRQRYPFSSHRPLQGEADSGYSLFCAAAQAMTCSISAELLLHGFLQGPRIVGTLALGNPWGVNDYPVLSG